MLMIKKSAVTKAVNSLEARGLIARRRGSDRRFNAVSLTAAAEGTRPPRPHHYELYFVMISDGYTSYYLVGRRCTSLWPDSSFFR